MAENVKLGMNDEKVLAAWNEWKDVCAVNGCSIESQSFLKKEIERGFWVKLCKYVENCDILKDLDDEDCTIEFDSALSEYEHSDQEGHEIYHKGHFGDKNRVRKAKCWKDFTWAKIADSPDPELKVIRGELIGKKSVMNQIVEDYVRRNYSGRTVKVERKDKKPLEVFRRDDSLIEQGDPSEDRGREKVSHIVYADSADIHLDRFDSYGFEHLFSSEPIGLSLKNQLRDFFVEILTIQECAVILAYLHKLPLYNEKKILSELGLGKSMANKMLTKSLEKLKNLLFSSKFEELREAIFSSCECRRFIESSMKERLCVEKYAPSLLSRIDDICGE